MAHNPLTTWAPGMGPLAAPGLRLPAPTAPLYGVGPALRQPINMGMVNEAPRAVLSASQAMPPVVRQMAGMHPAMARMAALGLGVGALAAFGGPESPGVAASGPIPSPVMDPAVLAQVNAQEASRNAAAMYVLGAQLKAEEDARNAAAMAALGMPAPAAPGAPARQPARPQAPRRQAPTPNPSPTVRPGLNQNIDDNTRARAYAALGLIPDPTMVLDQSAMQPAY